MLIYTDAIYIRWNIINQSHLIGGNCSYNWIFFSFGSLLKICFSFPFLRISLNRNEKKNNTNCRQFSVEVFFFVFLAATSNKYICVLNLYFVNSCSTHTVHCIELNGNAASFVVHTLCVAVVVRFTYLLLLLLWIALLLFLSLLLLLRWRIRLHSI